MSYVKWGGGLDSIEKVMHTSGFNYAMTALPVMGMAKSGMQGGLDTLDAFWWGSGGYETMGNTIGEMGAQGAEAAAMGVFAWESARKMGTTHGYRARLAGGLHGPTGVFPKTKGSNVSTGSMFKRGGVQEGLIKGNGKFFKPWGLGRSVAMMAGAAVAGAVFHGAASLTGRALDVMLDDTTKQRQLSYDNRFFAGQAKYDRGSYDSMGQMEPGSMFKMQDAMNEYQSKMMSMARVYHTR